MTTLLLRKSLPDFLRVSGQWLPPTFPLPLSKFTQRPPIKDHHGWTNPHDPFHNLHTIHLQASLTPTSNDLSQTYKYPPYLSRAISTTAPIQEMNSLSTTYQAPRSPSTLSQGPLALASEEAYLWAQCSA